MLAAGQVSGTGELAVTGTLSWTGGSMTEAGTTRVASGGRLVRELENTVFLETGRRVENEGTIDLRSDRFISVSGSPAPLIHNAGTVRQVGGRGDGDDPRGARERRGRALELGHARAARRRRRR